MGEQEARPAGLTEERMASLLAYCKLTELADDPEVQTLIPVLYDAAVGYMKGAGVDVSKLDTKQLAQYDLCVNCLVVSAYERRDMSIIGTTMLDNPVFRLTLNQLKTTGGGCYG